MDVQTKSKRVSLTAAAQHVLNSRKTDGVRTSVLTNSILLRYETMISMLTPVILQKFDVKEREELSHTYASIIESSGGKALWYFDSSDQKMQFIKIFRNAIDSNNLIRLNKPEATKVLEIMERHLNDQEFFCLCDWLSINSISAKRLNNVKVPN